MFFLVTPSHTPCHNRSRFCGKGHDSLVAVLTMASQRLWNGQNLITPAFGLRGLGRPMGSLPSLARPPLNVWRHSAERANTDRTTLALRQSVFARSPCSGAGAFAPGAKKWLSRLPAARSQLAISFSGSPGLAARLVSSVRQQSCPNTLDTSTASAADDRRSKDCPDISRFSGVSERAVGLLPKLQVHRA